MLFSFASPLQFTQKFQTTHYSIQQDEILTPNWNVPHYVFASIVIVGVDGDDGYGWGK